MIPPGEHGERVRAEQTLRRLTRPFVVLLLFLSFLTGAGEAAFGQLTLAEATSSTPAWVEPAGGAEQQGECPEGCLCSCPCACVPAPGLPAQRLAPSGSPRPQFLRSPATPASLASVVRSPRTRPPLA